MSDIIRKKFFQQHFFNVLWKIKILNEIQILIKIKHDGSRVYNFKLNLKPQLKSDWPGAV